MPHATFTDAPPLEEFWRQFRPFKSHDERGTITEGRSAFLRQDRKVVQVQCLVIEVGPPVIFHVLCEEKGNKVTIRCESHGHVARTRGVKELVRQVALQFLAMGACVESTNMELEQV